MKLTRRILLNSHENFVLVKSMQERQREKNIYHILPQFQRK